MFAFCYSRDRFRTAINVEGDSYGAGIIAHLSRNDLDSALPEFSEGPGSDVMGSNYSHQNGGLQERKASLDDIIVVNGGPHDNRAYGSDEEKSTAL